MRERKGLREDSDVEEMEEKETLLRKFIQATATMGWGHQPSLPCRS